MPRPSSFSCAGLNVDIERPRYDQSTYIGRAKHFFIITNPLNLLALPSTLDKAKERVTKYRRGDSGQECLTEDQLWRAKQLYDSAFHPDTGEKMILIGRMSAQVPMNTAITGGMMIFYKSTNAVIFWQWLNQSFNAIVNYTNRSGDAVISDKQILGSYVLATGASVATALGLNCYCKRLPPIYGRLVPFVAVVAANCVNIPIMRYEELSNGTPIYDENDKRLAKSRIAAIHGIAQVVLSRVSMPIPSMGLTPFVMDHLEKKAIFIKYPMLPGPLQLFMLALCLTFATPLCCALFVQRAAIKYRSLESSAREQLDKIYGSNPPDYVYYNKGL
ncbi:hypothetical protein Trydic_g17948 [Trypoxylus dichotomus]